MKAQTLTPADFPLSEGANWAGPRICKARKEVRHFIKCVLGITQYRAVLPLASYVANYSTIVTVEGELTCVKRAIQGISTR
ncbi:hypothetical protein JTB14_011881 [Gonioctena quinquepunctata]|nr:hypothetical protein JTB14_011881 [Gonioctena quinquepunctata]